MERKILVIDNEPLVRNLISNLLTLKQYRVDQAATREEAVGLLHRSHYDLILLDLMLPEDNGFALLDFVRQNFPRQSKHMVVMTGTDRKFVARLPEEGWCTVLMKPFSIAEFYRIVELCIDGSHAAGLRSN